MGKETWKWWAVSQRFPGLSWLLRNDSCNHYNYDLHHLDIEHRKKNNGSVRHVVIHTEHSAPRRFRCRWECCKIIYTKQPRWRTWSTSMCNIPSSTCGHDVCMHSTATLRDPAERWRTPVCSTIRCMQINVSFYTFFSLLLKVNRKFNFTACCFQRRRRDCGRIVACARCRTFY